MAKAVKMGGKEGQSVVGQFDCFEISATENGRWRVFTSCVIVMVESDVLNILLRYNPYPFPYVLVAKFAIIVKVEPFPYVLVAKFATVIKVKRFRSKE